MRRFWFGIIAIVLVCALSMTALAACNKKKSEPTEDKIDEPVKAEGIALNWQEALMVRGTSLTLAHTISPDGATGTATYTTSDAAVATVNAQGMVSAVGAGVATITAKIDDTHYAECRVVVGDMLVCMSEEESTSPTEGSANQGNTSNTTGEGATDTEGGNATNPDGNNEGTASDNGNTGTGTDEGTSTGDDLGGGDNTGTGGDTGTENGMDNTGNAGGNAGGSAGGENEGNDVGGTTGGATSGDNTGTPDDNTGNNGADNNGNPMNSGTESGNDQNASNGTMGGQTGNATGGNKEDNGEEEQAPIRRTVVGGTKGSTLFDKVQDAVAAATAGKVIVIDSGTYKQDVNIDKNLTLMGVKNPKLQAITVAAGAKVKLQNLTISLAEYPSAGEAAIHVLTGGDIEVVNCVITTSATGDPEGGYAVLVDKQSKGVKITDNSMGNFRYGVYVCPTDQSVRIENNKLSNMSVGIGLDVRQENAETNYPTLGAIRNNEYNEVEKHTQFLHYGENYDGDFDFGDNEIENTSNGQSDAGGSGLLE